MAVAVILGSCSSLMYSGNTVAAKLPDSNWSAIDRTGQFVIAPNFTYSYQAERTASRLAW